MATLSSILAWRIPPRGAWWAAFHGATKSRTQLSTVAQDYNIMYETSRQSRFDAQYWMLGAGALG